MPHSLIYRTLLLGILWGFSSACVAVNDPSRADLAPLDLLREADAAFDARQYEQALETYRLAAAGAQTRGAEDLFVQAAAQVAHVHLLLDQPEDGRVWLENAVERSHTDSPHGHVRVLLAQAAYQAAGGEMNTALTTCKQAHALARSIDAHVRAVQVAHYAAVISEGDEQLAWCRDALQDARKLGDGGLSAALWRQLGWLLEERGHFLQSLEAFVQCREELSDSKDSHDRMVADWQVGHSLRLVGRLGEARQLMDEIARRTQQIYQAQRGPNQAEWVGQALRELAELDLAEGKVERGLTRLRQAREYFVLAGAADLAPALLHSIDRRMAQIR